MARDKTRKQSEKVKQHAGAGDQNGGKTETSSINSNTTAGETHPHSQVQDKEIHICSFCKHEYGDADDKMMICERCGSYVCISCADLNAEEYSFMQRTNSLHWFCNTCETPAMNAVKSDRLIEEKCLALFKNFRQQVELDVKTQISELREEIVNKEIAGLRTELEQVKRQFGNHEKNETGNEGSSEKKEKKEDVLSELEERNRRKANLVWFGVPESGSEDVNERKKADARFITDCCSRTLGVKVEIGACRRLRSQAGSQTEGGSGKRPLLVTLKDSNDVGMVLREAKKLRSSQEFNSVFVKKDSTPLERAELKKLLAVRDQKRQDTKQKGGEENWVIRNGKIVNFTRRQEERRK